MYIFVPAINRVKIQTVNLTSPYSLFQGLSINGFVNVVITSIERRFGLNSTQTGTIASTYDIGSMIIMIPVCFLGGKIGSSKPRSDTVVPDKI